LSFHSYSGAALIANLTRRNLLFDKSRSMVKVAIGENVRVMLEHKQAFGKTLNNFATVTFLYESLPLPFYDPKNLKNQEYLYRLKLSTIDLNYKKILGNNNGIGLGLGYLRQGLSPDVSANASLDGFASNYFAYINYEANTINRRFFPTSGYLIFGELGTVFGRKNELFAYSNDSSFDISNIVPTNVFQKFKLSAARFTPLSKKLTLISHLNLSAQNNYTGFILDNFFLGGIQPMFRSQVVFSGLKEGQINTSSFSGLNLGLQYKLISELYLIARGSGGFYGYSTKKYIVDTNAAKGIVGASLSLGYNLSVMPIEFTIMYSPQVGTAYGHVRVGFLF
jgi:NTE family protein